MPATDLPSEIAAVVRSVLQRLNLPFTEEELARRAAEEHEVAFRSPSWPRVYTEPYVPDGDDVPKLTSAVVEVLLRYELSVSLVEQSLESLRVHATTDSVYVLIAEKSFGSNALATLTSFDGNLVTLTESGHARTVGVDTLKELHSGYVIEVARRKKSREYGLRRTRNHRRVRSFLQISAISTLFFMAIVAAADLGRELWFPIGSLVAGCAAGAFLCVLLRRVEADRPTIADQFCHARASFDCKRVLSSAAAKVLGVVSMADLGLGFFVALATGTLLGVVTGRPQDAYCAAAVAVGAAIPYVFFSIGYQAFVVRAWCPLCLSVQATLVFLAGSVLWSLRSIPWRFPTAGAVLMATAFATALSGAYVASMLKQRESETLQLTANFLSLKRNPVVFRSLLTGSEQVDVAPLPGDIRLTNGTGSVDLMAVLDPQCHKCARCYLDLLDWAVEFHDRLTIRIRVVAEFTPLEVLADVAQLTTRGDHREAALFLADWYRHILALARAGIVTDAGKVNMAVYRAWRETDPHRIPMPPTVESAAAVTRSKAWETASLVTKWPALVVAGYAWPPQYDRQHYLPYFLDELEAFVSGDAVDELEEAAS